MPTSNSNSSDQKLTVAIADAGGYIGRWLIKEYRHKFNFVALSRQKVDRVYDTAYFIERHANDQ